MILPSGVNGGQCSSIFHGGADAAPDEPKGTQLPTCVPAPLGGHP